MADLNLELRTYANLLPTLLGDQGKFVLIKGANLIATFDSYSDALNAGYERFKLEPFLIKQVAAAAQVAFVTRDLVPCQA